jgi:hypothetical protein
MTNLLRFPHQMAGTTALLEKPAAILGWRPGRGKSRTVTDTTFALHSADRIDAVVVVCPANLRSIWADPDPVLGEFAKWAWPTPYTIHEYHRKTNLKAIPAGGLRLVVTNYEFIRRPERLDPLIDWCRGRRVLLVVDESWAVANPRAQQTKSVWKLRHACQRVVLLNGTLGEPKEQFAQLSILSKDVFAGMNWWQFRNKFCQLGGFQGKKIVGYTNQDEYAKRTAPYILLDDGGDDFARIAPPVRTTLDATLTPATWKIYQDLRRDFVAWLSEHETATAAQAGVRAMRLAQVVNGFVGGVEVEGGADEEQLRFNPGPLAPLASPVKEIGREKLDALLGWLNDYGVPDKLLIFTRFRVDVERTVAALAELYPGHTVLPLYGSQKDEVRSEAKRLLAPNGDPRPAIVVANAQSGGAGLNLAAASVCVFLANDYSLKTRLQAEGRVDRTGQQAQVRFVDVLASGPDGQKTIDHLIVSALRKKEDVVLTNLAAWHTLEAAA